MMLNGIADPGQRVFLLLKHGVLLRVGTVVCCDPNCCFTTRALLLKKDRYAQKHSRACWLTIFLQIGIGNAEVIFMPVFHPFDAI
jgi:hypothetical protein